MAQFSRAFFFLNSSSLVVAMPSHSRLLDKADFEQEQEIIEKFKALERERTKKFVLSTAEEEENKVIITAIDKPCRCGHFCLKRLKSSPNNYENAVSMVRKGRCEIIQQGFNSLSEQKDTLRSKFKASIISTDARGRNKHNFSVGEGESKINDVCREAWARFHGVGVHTVDKLGKEFKSGKSRIIDNSLRINSLNNPANRHGKFLTKVR